MASVNANEVPQLLSAANISSFINETIFNHTIDAVSATASSGVSDAANSVMLPPYITSTLLFAISGFFSFSLLWSLFLYPVSAFGWNVYLIDDERHLQTLKQKYVRSATIINNNEAFGWVFGYWYIGYIYATGDRFSKTQSCYILARKDLMNDVTQPVFTEDVGRKEIYIKLHDRCGNYDYIYYTERKLNVTDFHPREAQAQAIDHIEKYYKENKFATVLLAGPPNAGKSVISLLLTKRLKGSLVYEFNPTEPGNNFNNLYNKANPTFSCPLIVTFEEVDGMIEAIHQGKVLRHEHKPISIYNKATWNTFMDNIDHRFYPFVVFLFTTNRLLQWFETLDPSYMRQGRVNVKIRLTETSCELVNDSILNKSSCNEENNNSNCGEKFKHLNEAQ
jgi:hypothetical protein